jgi:hypothetical protein
MSVETRSRVDPVLPPDVTLRVPGLYRAQGLVTALLASIVLAGINYRLDRAHGRRRRYRHAPPVPERLREDIGLPPPLPRLPEW